LVVDDRRSFATTGSGDPVVAALETYGAEVGEAALPLRPLEESAAVPGVVVEGWVGGPSVTRSHRQGIVLFVNGRWVQHRALSFALEEAYHSLLMVGRHPVAVVHLKLDPAAVDVNVHPTKAEVKFVDERAACRALSRSVHAALSRAPRAALPHIRFEPPAERPRQIVPSWASSTEPERRAAPETPSRTRYRRPTPRGFRCCGCSARSAPASSSPRGRTGCS
jgi:DNA mismatch repair protein MutL